jgi:hypothetical protein
MFIITVRIAEDLNLRETPRYEGAFPGNPLEYGRLPLSYRLVVAGRRRAGGAAGERAALAKEWETVLHREVKWKMAYDRTLRQRLRYGVALIQTSIGRTNSRAPAAEKRDQFFASISPLRTRDRKTPLLWQQILSRPLHMEMPKNLRYFEFIPSKVVQLRVFR